MPFKPGAPLGSRRTLIRRNPDNPQEIEVVEAVWGMHIGGEDREPFQFLRLEGTQSGSQRCLVPANEFHVCNGDRKFRVTLDDGSLFYLAGVWQPATRGTSFAVVTIKANPDVSPFQERQGAVLLRRQNMAWLDLTEPYETLLQPLPPGSYHIEEIAHAAPMPQPAELVF